MSETSPELPKTPSPKIPELPKIPEVPKNNSRSPRRSPPRSPRKPRSKKLKIPARLASILNESPEIKPLTPPKLLSFEIEPNLLDSDSTLEHEKSFSKIIREIAESARSPERTAYSPTKKEVFSKIDIKVSFSSECSTENFTNKYINNFIKDLEDITPTIKNIIDNDFKESDEKINLIFNNVLLPYIIEKTRYSYRMNNIEDYDKR